MRRIRTDGIWPAGCRGPPGRRRERRADRYCHSADWRESRDDGRVRDTPVTALPWRTRVPAGLSADRLVLQTRMGIGSVLACEPGGPLGVYVPPGLTCTPGRDNQ
jgi:hypothetical protein